ncbi:hypothetical protein H632_c71p2 [Helicosporidium sp. ATCC 50920]|nr:hypothetical protein H632_c71p2 [Helicosporidium sp. ATCC 50920]|eukprot:KDD76905.1 hypothetical protein H632_c71p2 [Helicosporidium sp. ATCC 50920]
MVAQMPVPSPALSPLVSYVPPSTATFGCPTEYSVTKYGATGAGTNNDALAVSRANSALSALYFPLRAGQSSATYLFASSITISKPIVVPCGTTLQVGPGATLTIAMRPKIMCETRPTFAGSGKVAFTGAGGDEIHPVWFGQPYADDAAAFQRAVNACSSACTVLLTRSMSLARPVALSWRTGVLATAGALLFPSAPRQGSGPWPKGGVVFTPGQYRRPVVLASTTSFETHVAIQSGVTNAQLFAGVLQHGQDGIRLMPSAGQSVSGTAVQNVVACSLLEVCVAVVAPSSGAAARISNVVVRVNFVVAVTRAAVEFRGGVPPTLSRFGVVVQALDPNKMTASFQAVRNAMGRAVTGFIFSVETWAGGFMTPADNKGRLPSGQLVWGPWNSLSASFSLAAVDQMPPLNAFSNQGSNNYYGIPYIASAGYLLPLASSPSNAAVLPLYSVVYFVFNFRTAWKANESRTFYLLTPYAASVPASKMKCLVFNLYNPWLTCSRIVNNNAKSTYDDKDCDCAPTTPTTPL